MSKEQVTVRNRETGSVGQVPRHIAEHDVFGKHLEIVPAGSKPKVRLKVERQEKPLESKTTKKEEAVNGTSKTV